MAEAYRVIFTLEIGFLGRLIGEVTFLRDNLGSYAIPVLSDCGGLWPERVASQLATERDVLRDRNV